GCVERELKIPNYSAISGVDDEGRLLDAADIYESSDDIVQLRVTIIAPDSDGKCTADDGFGQEDYSGCTLEDVESDVNNNDAFDPFVRAHFMAEDYPDDGLESNASLSIRGHSSRYAAQKSFKIKLDKGLRKWRGQRNIQINKHPYDPMRITNKLSLDLLQNVDNFISLRTTFVRLYIKNEDHEGRAGVAEQDFGLFTHVERPNDDWLETRGHAKNTALWKTYNLMFYPPEMTPSLFKEIDSRDFKRILKPIGVNKDNKDKGLLLEMLRAVNDCSSKSRVFYDSDFYPVFNNYFHPDNFRTWLAVNILLNHAWVGNGENIILYRREGDSRFYFLPWDYDGTWYGGIPLVEKLRPLPRWTKGISNWWAMPLVRRYIQIPGEVEKLTKKVETIASSAFLPEVIEAQLDDYPLDEISNILQSSPDREHILNEVDLDSEPAEVRRSLLNSLSSTVKSTELDYLDNIERPMPIKQWVKIRNGKLIAQWESSYDIQGDNIFYDVTLASSYVKGSQSALCNAQPGSPVRELSSHLKFQRSVSNSPGEVQELELGEIEIGSYYLQIIVRDEKGYCQTAYDWPSYHNNMDRFGIYPFNYDGSYISSVWM
ncbi:CotH kinase family protein, partial [Alcanivorax jadensis]|uniref:CotH kinase family protein n=1 Tax=Alcanivorax jadensis TaxID=64988 RepID=UPI00240A4AD2